MSYPKVLALLDAQLERLRAAREILTSGSENTPEPGQLAELPEILANLNQPKDAPGTLMPSTAVQAVRVAPKQRRERRSAVRRRKQDDPGALGSAVPNAPVYVSADKIRSTPTDRPNGHGVGKKEEPLSPELLARRWLQTTANSSRK